MYWLVDFLNQMMILKFFMLMPTISLARSQNLPYKDNRFTSQVTMRIILESDDSAETGFFAEVQVNYPARESGRKITEKTMNFPFSKRRKLIMESLVNINVHYSHETIDHIKNKYMIGAMRKIV